MRIKETKRDIAVKSKFQLPEQKSFFVIVCGICQRDLLSGGGVGDEKEKRLGSRRKLLYRHRSRKRCFLPASEVTKIESERQADSFGGALKQKSCMKRFQRIAESGVFQG